MACALLFLPDRGHYRALDRRRGIGTFRSSPSAILHRFLRLDRIRSAVAGLLYPVEIGWRV